MVHGITGKKSPRGGTSSSERVRESNIELYRIISMLLIVAHHFVVNSGLIAQDGPIYADPLSQKSLFLLVFGAWGKIGINCFVLITGYFMCMSTVTVRKFAKLLLEFMFYRIVIYLIFLLTGYEAFSAVAFVKMIIPISQVGTNFTGCFIIFYLSIPFLNALVHHLTERSHILLLCLTGFLYIIFGTAHRITMNYVSWFVVLFFIASFIRLYPRKSFSNTRLWGSVMLITLIVAAISVIAGTWVGVKINHHMHYAFVSDCNTLLAVALGISSFLFFKNIKIRYSKVINTIAASTFGVLCIHANSDTMRRWLWGDFLDVIGHYYKTWMPLYAISCVVGLFAVCIIIDMVLQPDRIVRK